MAKPQVSGSTINMFFSMADDTQKNFELRSDESWISWDCLGVRKQLSDCVRAIRREVADPTRKGGSKLGPREFTNDNLVVAMSHMLTVYKANCCLAVETSKTPKKYIVLPCGLHGEDSQTHGGQLNLALAQNGFSDVAKIECGGGFVVMRVSSHFYCDAMIGNRPDKLLIDVKDARGTVKFRMVSAHG